MIDFDPQIVGNYEFSWWKAHNDKDKKSLAENLLMQNIALYGLSETEAQHALQYLAKSVGYHDTRDWGKAEEGMGNYYNIIKKRTGLKFDPQEIGVLEVGWWKLHDELEFVDDKTPLIQAFQKLYGTIFGLPEENLLKAATIRAQATKEHDLAEKSETPAEEVGQHWQNTEQLLIEFYQELQKSQY